MSRTRADPLHALGIALGVIAGLVVVGSAIAIARQQMGTLQEGLAGMEGPWGAWMERDSGRGSPVRVEAEEVVPGGSREIEVRTVAGSIDIQGEAGASRVEVHSVRTAASAGALDHVRVEIRSEGDRLILEEKHDPGFVGRTGTASFRITVPRAVRRIDAHSVSGAITVQGTGPDVRQTLSTISGAIRTEESGDLEISSTSGSVRFASHGSTLVVRTVSGSIDGTIEDLAAGGSARVGSVSGSVSLNVFEGLSAMVSLRSLSGRVSCGFPMVVSEQKNNRLSGKVGTGAARLEAETVSGSIDVSKG